MTALTLPTKHRSLWHFVPGLALTAALTGAALWAGSFPAIAGAGYSLTGYYDGTLSTATRLRVIYESALGEVELWNKSAAAQLDAQLRFLPWQTVAAPLTIDDALTINAPVAIKGTLPGMNTR